MTGPLMSHLAERQRAKRMTVVTALAALGGACVDDAVTLPADWNTLHHRQISVDIFTRVTGEAGHGQPFGPSAGGLALALQGIDGAPLGRHPGLPDLTHSYWDRPGGSDEPDGAHVDIVRIGPESCALTLDGMYEGGEPQPESFDFAELERHAASVEAIRGDGLLLSLDVSQPGQCGDVGQGDDPFAAAIAAPEIWAEAAASTVRHLVGDTLWNPRAHAYPVAGVQLFRLSTDHEQGAFALFAAAARRAVGAEVAIVSPELALTSAADVTAGPLARFLAAVKAEAVPLDVLSLHMAGDASTVAGLIATLAKQLESLELSIELAVTTLDLPPLDLPFTPGSPLGLAHLGASEMAARIRLQGLPVRWLLSGRGPWTLAPGHEVATTGAPADDDLVATPYFDRAGVPTAAFVMRAPMRQVEGEQRVLATTDAGDGLSVLATLDAGHGQPFGPSAGGHLSILIAHPATATGVGAITYTLTIPAFTLPTFRSVDYRLSELDQSNRGIASFFYADLGSLETDPTTGDIRIVRTLPVPGVHFIEIDQPLP